jgi:hypothetical protein
MISATQLEQIKADNPCDEYARSLVSLRKGRGVWKVGPCPVCSRDPKSPRDSRFEVCADGWVCAVCDDGGDVIKLLAKVENLSFLEAVERLGGARPIDPDLAAKRAAELARLKAERESHAEQFRERERNSVFSIWQAGAPAEGSVVEDYLRKRGLTLPSGARLRCVADQAYFEGEVEGEDGRKYKRIIHRGPAMLAAIQGPDRSFRGLHFTYLDVAKPKGKAEIIDPDTGEILKAKKTRGSKLGGRIELVRPASYRRLVIGEGIETTLAAWCALVAAGLDDGETAYWSAVDLGNIGGRAKETVLHPELKDAVGRRRHVPGPVPVPAPPSPDHLPLDIPDDVVRVILLGDGDSDRFNTENALRRAAIRWAKPGRAVCIAWAPPGGDFNDIDPARAAAIIAAAQPFDASAADQAAAPAEADNVVSLDAAQAARDGKAGGKAGDGGGTKPPKVEPQSWALILTSSTKPLPTSFSAASRRSSGTPMMRPSRSSSAGGSSHWRALLRISVIASLSFAPMRARWSRAIGRPLGSITPSGAPSMA